MQFQFQAFPFQLHVVHERRHPQPTHLATWVVIQEIHQDLFPSRLAPPRIAALACCNVCCSSIVPTPGASSCLPAPSRPAPAIPQKFIVPHLDSNVNSPRVDSSEQMCYNGDSANKLLGAARSAAPGPPENKGATEQLVEQGSGAGCPQRRLRPLSRSPQERVKPARPGPPDPGRARGLDNSHCEEGASSDATGTS